jgi:hypothetical protein
MKRNSGAAQAKRDYEYYVRLHFGVTLESHCTTLHLIQMSGKFEAYVATKATKQLRSQAPTSRGLLIWVGQGQPEAEHAVATQPFGHPL